MIKYIYRRPFLLTDPVKDFAAASEYLLADDMTKYLKEDKRIDQNIRDTIQSIQWILIDTSSGYVELISNSILDSNALDSLKDFVEGQNDSGLGAGFSEQDFANYVDEGLIGYEGSHWDDEEISVGINSSNVDFGLVNTYIE
jgi:hypothetical protein